MKKLMFLFLLLSTNSFGYSVFENEGNPDKDVSFALNTSNGHLYGGGVSTEYLTSSSLVNVPFEDATENQVNLWSISPSVRFPVSPRLTIDMGMSYLSQKYSYDGNLTRFRGNLKGEIYQIGFRYYFKD